MSCWVTSSHIFEWNDVKAGLSYQIQQMIDNLCQTYTSKSIKSILVHHLASELQNWFGTRSRVFTCIYCIFCINSMFKSTESFRLEKTVKISTSNQQPFKQHGPMLWRTRYCLTLSHMSRLLQNSHSQAVLLMLMLQSNALGNR